MLRIRSRVTAQLRAERPNLVRKHDSCMADIRTFEGMTHTTIIDDRPVRGGTIGGREMLTEWKVCMELGMGMVPDGLGEDEATMYVAQYVGQYKLSFDLQMIVRSRFELGGAQHMGAGMFRMSPRAERWVGGSTHGGGEDPHRPHRDWGRYACSLSDSVFLSCDEGAELIGVRGASAVRENNAEEFSLGGGPCLADWDLRRVNSASR